MRVQFKCGLFCRFIFLEFLHLCFCDLVEHETSLGSCVPDSADVDQHLFVPWRKAATFFDPFWGAFDKLDKERKSQGLLLQLFSGVFEREDERGRVRWRNRRRAQRCQIVCETFFK